MLSFIFNPSSEDSMTKWLPPGWISMLSCPAFCLHLALKDSISYLYLSSRHTAQEKCWSEKLTHYMVLLHEDKEPNRRLKEWRDAEAPHSSEPQRTHLTVLCCKMVAVCCFVWTLCLWLWSGNECMNEIKFKVLANLISSHQYTRNIFHDENQFTFLVACETSGTIPT